MISFERGNIRAPELFGDHWLNSDALMIRDLRGSVVLVEFWDYANTSCARTLPYIREWFHRYRDFNLVSIGVHTPQFKFGGNPENVEAAMHRAGIDYPVVMDNSGVIWTAYSSRMWPTRFLVDRDGFLRFSHQGEGGYGQFERSIQSLLVEAGYHGVYPDILLPFRDTDAPGAICYQSTPEIQLGYLRGTLGNPEGHGPESTILYGDQGLHLVGRLYLDGKWFNEREGMRYDGESGEKGCASFAYEGMEVDSVMSADGREAVKVTVTQDGKSLSKDQAGLDIRFDGSGASYFLVGEPRRFNIVRNRDYGRHELSLSMTSPGVEIFTFSFVSGVIPELVPAR